MITKDGRDLPVEKLTAENYVVPKGEEKVYHALIEVTQFDQKTGKKLSRGRVQKFGRKIFESSVRASLVKQGYEIVILHDPTEWLKEQAGKAAAKAKADAEAKKKAEQEKFDAAVAAAVAKALASQKNTTDAPAYDAPEYAKPKKTKKSE